MANNQVPDYLIFAPPALAYLCLCMVRSRTQVFYFLYNVRNIISNEYNDVETFTKIHIAP